MTPTPQPESSSAIQPWLQRHARLSTILLALVIFLLLLVVPPFISISSYKSHVTQLVASALGRPVRLSSVELRMLPRPGFILTDLTVEEDPAYGSEPVLHASTVVAYVHLWSLWRGHLSLDKISVEDASLNLVRAANGRWNVDSFFRATSNAAAGAVPQPGKQPLLYLEATNSRINLKSSAEKLPYSLTGTDASLWQDDGAWHIRLRGQPVRTDVSLNAADTGIVRLEATLHPETTVSGQTSRSQMPLHQAQIHLDLDWREAQLGQLTRLILGSDEDWRGDLTGELHLDGTAATAKVTSRLRATGVHRAEFQPASPLDFDATCSFLYHSANHDMGRTFENIACNSPIGQGRLRLTGNMPSAPAQPHLTLELDRVPAQAPIDLLRTLRGNLDQGLSANGAFSGKMTYAPAEVASVPVVKHAARSKKSERVAPVFNPLEGIFTAEDVKISGEGISTPIDVSKITLEPAPAEPGQSAALAAAVSIPAGVAAPLAVNARLMRSGFAVTIRGAATLARLRELAQVAGIAQSKAMSQLSGAPAALDLRIEGPWLANAAESSATQPADASARDDSAKKLTGSIALHNAAWKPDFLASPVEISSATLRFEDGQLKWDPVAFAYGPAGTQVKGTATLSQPIACTVAVVCTPRFTLHFAALNATELQSALLGAKEQGTLLSTLLDRFRSNPAPNWPVLQGSVQADSFTAGVFTFSAASADLRIEPSAVKIAAFTARALGGQVHGTGSLTVLAKQDGKPAYMLDASFAGVNPAQLGQLVGEKWSGSAISGSGTLGFSGFTAQDLAASAQGSLSFDWRTGRMGQAVNFPLLTSFTRWNGVAKIEKSALTLGENHVHSGSRVASAAGGITFLPEARATLTTPRR